MSENELSFVLLIEPFHNGVGVLRHNLRVDAADHPASDPRQALSHDCYEPTYTWH